MFVYVNHKIFDKKKLYCIKFPIFIYSDSTTKTQQSIIHLIFYVYSFQLPQEEPTISQLKRAIEAQARVQLKRELRERQEERQRRRRQSAMLPTATIMVEHEEANSTTENAKTSMQKQQHVTRTCESHGEYNKSVRLTGELVCSATHNGHQHRPNVSWRYLWRAYALYNLATKSVVNDENGRKLLSECGIENAQTLKFTKRDKYLGKKRQ